jgi:hypothetical protein
VLIIGLVFGGINMPLKGSIPAGGTFFCPQCGALYSVTQSRPSKVDSNLAIARNIAKCVVCLQTMSTWEDSAEARLYKLIQRPEDA